MNKLHLRYFLTALLGGLATAWAFQTFIGTILVPEIQAGMTGAAFLAGLWGNIIAAFVIAMMSARKATRELESPMLGRIAGLAMGLWVGAGALVGSIAFGALFASVKGALVRPGLVLVFGLIGLGVAIVTASITGRETAQPPEQEEA
jgi:hypothetical protein